MWQVALQIQLGKALPFTYETTGWTGVNTKEHDRAGGQTRLATGDVGPQGYETPVDEGTQSDLFSGGTDAMNDPSGLNAFGTFPMGMASMNPMSNMNNMMSMFPMVGGQMGMAGMNGMGAMNPGMNYGMMGNNWNGQMNGGYGMGMNGNFPMNGYNQSGGAHYSEMNQFPRNNFHKQNRFHGQGNYAQTRHFGRGAHQGHGNYGYHNQGQGFGAQRMNPYQAGGRVGSQDMDLPRPTSQDHRPSNQFSAETAQPSQKNDLNALNEKKLKSSDGVLQATDISQTDQSSSSAVKSVEGKAGADGSAESDLTASNVSLAQAQITNLDSKAKQYDELTISADILQPIQTVEAVDPPGVDLVGSFPHQSMPQHGMMDDYSNPMSSMNGGYGYGQGYNSGGYTPRSGVYPSAAYGSTTVLTPGEPQGVGVAGAPTGPRAMREGRHNTGPPGRNNNRFPAPPSAPSVASTQEATGSGQNRSRRYGRIHPPREPFIDLSSKTPGRDDSLRVRARRYGSLAPQDVAFANSIISKTPERDETLRLKAKSPSRSRSRSHVRGDDERYRDPSRERGRDQSRSPSRHQKKRYERSSSRDAEGDYERRHHRSSRPNKHEDKSRSDYYERDGDIQDYHDKVKSRGASVESKHRSRRDKDKERHRSSRHDRSREYRRRHRSRTRSRSLVDEVKAEDYDQEIDGRHAPNDSSGQRKSRSGRHRERDYYGRERDRHDKDRDHDRDYDRDYGKDYGRDYDKNDDREYDRSRDKDREREKKRSSRRDRSMEPDDDYENERYHRSSRRSRKEREKEKDRGRERDRKRDYHDDAPVESRDVSPPPINAPKGPAASSEFKIIGRGRDKNAPVSTKTEMAPPVQPKSADPIFQAPKGPAAERARDSHDRNGLRDGAGTPITPTPPAMDKDPIEIERENRAREREMRHQRLLMSDERRSSGQRESKPQLSTKRTREEVDVDGDRSYNETTVAPSQPATRKDSTDSSFAPPVGPSAHRDKRRKSGDKNGVDAMFVNALRLRSRGGRKTGAGDRVGRELKSRRGGAPKYEDEVADERSIKQVERERNRGY
ncbi:hypothetical protein GQ43DRAFT_21203 [Delitschia confertaspora ATCC 74209]|uniref:Uncharacterized protein n=1 Tax=Delitschia confertaspora ATCC 74209 TaxID=1513339 RepID=A0A9P4MW58_9PLEO|nr:hypothetical protein GQ43DRAFT_21203 [Delitschia confertaspora ATCC 74209]